jgi:DNA polymerase elongation subunit (family B)
MIPDFSENGNKAKDNQKIPKIESYRDEIINSASFDFEWIPFKGKYQHDKTKLYAACFCTNWGERVVLHISKYSNKVSPERALIQDILFYLNQFPLTFGWYSTGVAVYDDQGNRVRGRDSDLFILHQRCLLYGVQSPIELRKTYAQFKDKNKKHIDLFKVFEKPIIQNGVFEGRYRTTDLNTVSISLLHIGKYSDLNAGLVDITSLLTKEQESYVMRDAELTMLLAQYNKCLVLRIIKIFAHYAELDYFMTCHTNISFWYANKYDKMIEKGECTVSFTPNHKLPKLPISGGHHSIPVKGFFENTKIYELDVKGQYPSIVINNNFSFDTLNCICCKNDQKARLKQETINTINDQLKENNIQRHVTKYWICQKRRGAFPKLLEQVLSDRDRFLQLLHEEKLHANPNPFLIEEYQTHQLGAKLFANAGFGLFGNEYFKYPNYQVAECITAEGRRIHKEMERKGECEPYNFEVVFGFTDSTFFSNATEDMIQEFISDCQSSLRITVELKNIFTNSVFYGKKNRYVAWTGSEKDHPIIKGLDGLADSNPLWIRRLVRNILVEIIKHPDTRLEMVPKMLNEGFLELQEIHMDKQKMQTELKFTQHLKKSVNDYADHIRAGAIARLLGKDKGDIIHWYETIKEIKINKKSGKQRILSGYSIIPDNLNVERYKMILMSKLKDTFEIVGIELSNWRCEIRIENATG